MIGWFPVLHHGELLYSGCARLESALRYPRKTTLLSELTGGRSRIPAIDLPARLGVFVQQLPPGPSYTPDFLIDRHTLWPYYAPFRDRETQIMSRRALIVHGGSDVRKFIGSRMYGRLVPPFLRYCPVCRDQDLGQHGEFLWHRLHQAPGVLICPQHAVFLAMSTVAWRWRHGSQRFVLDANAMPPVLPRPVDTRQRSHRLLLELAKDVAWLLDQPRLMVPIDDLRRVYRHAAREHGFPITGSTNYAQMEAALIAHYSHKTLRWLQADEFLRDRKWLQTMLWGPSKTKGHPLMHLVLAHFLGLTFRSIGPLLGTTWTPDSG